MPLPHQPPCPWEHLIRKRATRKRGGGILPAGGQEPAESHANPPFEPPPDPAAAQSGRCVARLRSRPYHDAALTTTSTPRRQVLGRPALAIRIVRPDRYRGP